MRIYKRISQRLLSRSNQLICIAATKENLSSNLGSERVKHIETLVVAMSAAYTFEPWLTSEQ